MTTKKVLIVDDDQSILDAISIILEEEGYAIDTTFKGEETYNKISSFKPDVILLDVLMSGHDGRIICKNLKQDAVAKKIPIIMISAHPSAKEGAVESGAEAFLAKPFEVNDLLQLVAKYTS